MDSRKFILRQTLIVSVGQAIGIGIMLAVFALLSRFDRSVWLGGILGGIIAIANFFVMAVCADLASDRAEQGNVKSGQALVKLSYFGRLAVMVIVLFALVKSGLCNVITAVVPLALTRPTLTLAEFFRKGNAK